MKHIRLVLAWATLAGLAVQSFAQPITVYVNNDRVDFTGSEPIKMNDRVMVPLRGVFEKMGADVRWNDGDLSVYASKGPKTVWLRIGDHDAKIDGNSVRLDQPATLHRGTTMVPIRFISEALGADVKWSDSLQSVTITTTDAWTGGNQGSGSNNDGGQWREVTFDSGQVIPVTLDEPLNSDTARKGDVFMATIDTDGNANYAGLPRGTKIVGHVTHAKAMKDKSPGVLGLEYDELRTPDGQKWPIEGSLIALDDKNVETKNGRLVAKGKQSSKTEQNVLIGAGAGAVIALLTKGNLLTDTLIGGALGYVYDLIQKGDRRAADVDLKAGTKLGVKVDQDFVARIGR